VMTMGQRIVPLFHEHKLPCLSYRSIAVEMESNGDGMAKACIVYIIDKVRDH
jgi:hypothetical protein